MNDDELKEIYYDPKYGFPDVKKLLEIVGKKYTRKQVSEFIKAQEVNQIHKRDNKNQKIFAPIVGDVGWFQTDLTFLDQYKNQNKGYHIILTCIDILSRKGYTRALKNKTEDTVVEAFESILKEVPIKMTMLGFDGGSEFKSKFRAMLKKNEVEFYMSDAGDKNKMAMVERFNLTIRNRIEKYMTAFNTNKWFDVLQDITYAYNNTEHSSTGFKPDEVSKKEYNLIWQMNEERVKDYYEDNTKVFNKGDRVRLVKQKGAFEKKSGQQYNKSIYEVVKINPFSYKVKNIESETVLQRTVKPYELQLVESVAEFAPPKPQDRQALIKQTKVQRQVKKQGIDPTNVLSVGRRQTNVAGLNTSNILTGKRRR